MVLRLPDSWSNWSLEMLVFEQRVKQSTWRKPLGAKERTNNKLNPQMESKPGFEPGPQWWEASALTNAPSLAPLSTVCSLRGTDILSLWRPASTSYGLHSFNYFACKTWNSLPENIRMESTLAGLKCLIQTISFHST